MVGLDLVVKFVNFLGSFERVRKSKEADSNFDMELKNHKEGKVFERLFEVISMKAPKN